MAIPDHSEEIAQAQRDLELVRAKRREVLTAGEQISVASGVSVKQPHLEALAKEERRLMRRIAALQGFVQRTAPDFRQTYW